MNRTQIIVLTSCIMAVLCIVGAFIIDIIAGCVLLVLLCIGIGYFAYIKRDLFNDIKEKTLGKKEDKKVEKIDKPVNNTPTNQKQDDLQLQFASLKEHINHIADRQQNALDNLSSKILDLNSAILILQQQYYELQEKVEFLSSRIPQEIPTVKESPPPTTKYPITYYAQIVDSQSPLGFSQRALTKERDKSFFIITLSNETDATYSIITDANLQEGIISMFNPIITDSSEYDNLPPKITNIYTSQEGVLKLCNGIWQIIKKQKIHIE